MKKSLRTILTTGLLAATLTLASCGVSESWAKKINDRAEKEDYYTYEELTKSLGTPTYDLTVEVLNTGKNGAVIWVKGCKNSDEVDKKLDEGKELYALSVGFIGGKATSADWSQYTNEKK